MRELTTAVDTGSSLARKRMEFLKFSFFTIAVSTGTGLGCSTGAVASLFFVRFTPDTRTKAIIAAIMINTNTHLFFGPFFCPFFGLIVLFIFPPKTVFFLSIIISLYFKAINFSRGLPRIRCQ